ncbi:hypothetical protein [Acaryochloris sp. IP29b_bin.137]|uniref:hypothetical protein n=1 Tax=Acaryochloris sp. IP29b_bin.137 TaxID=2969217 RepID=UPI002617B8E0|nr:hypothetical protein [Acaryochloris sp. IP29b_bin.137]
MANNQQQRSLETTCCPALPPRLGRGDGVPPKGKVQCTSISAPNRLRGHGLNAAEPDTGLRWPKAGRRPSQISYLAKRRAGVPEGLQESRCVVPLSALLLVAARSALLEQAPEGQTGEGVTKESIRPMMPLL